jgi:hypothetical protein
MVENSHQECDASEIVAPVSLNDVIGTIESFVLGQEWPLRLQNAWQRVKEVAVARAAATESGTPKSSDDGDIRTIKAQLEGLTKMVRCLAELAANIGKPSYAEILRRGAPATGATTVRIVPVPARRAREVVISPGNESPVQKQRPGREIVLDINTRLGGEGVVAARRLLSEEVLVTFDSEDQKKRGVKAPEIVQAFGSNARVKVREFTVMAHGIPVAAIDTQNQAGAIEELYRQNLKLRGEVDIVHLGWAKKTITQGKKAAPLHIGIAEPGQANRLIEQGLLFCSELHDSSVIRELARNCGASDSPVSLVSLGNR